MSTTGQSGLQQSSTGQSRTGQSRLTAVHYWSVQQRSARLTAVSSTGQSSTGQSSTGQWSVQAYSSPALVSPGLCQDNNATKLTGVTHMSKKLYKSVVCYFIQAFIKPTTFLWLPKFLLELLIRIDVFRCKKCPVQLSIIIIIISPYIHKHHCSIPFL